MSVAIFLRLGLLVVLLLLLHTLLILNNPHVLCTASRIGGTSSAVRGLASASQQSGRIGVIYVWGLIAASRPHVRVGCGAADSKWWRFLSLLCISSSLYYSFSLSCSLSLDTFVFSSWINLPASASSWTLLVATTSWCSPWAKPCQR